MQFVRYLDGEDRGVGVVDGDAVVPIRLESAPRGREPDPVDAVLGDWAPVESRGPTPLAEVDLLAPVGSPSKIVAVGLNYHDHAAEAGLDVPEEPRIFLKAPSSVIGPNEPIVYPPETAQLDYEAELAVVIGDRGRRIDAADALAHVAGFSVFNDVSARDIQFEAPHIDRGKGFDTFGPFGPTLTTPDALDFDDLAMRTTVNGSVRQASSTAEMMFSVPELIEYISSSMTLNPGDVIPTGTPAGVGVHADPPALLEPGDTVSITIEDIGTLTNPVRAEG